MSSASSYRQALSQFATGVTVVTTCDSLGCPVGVTINSFTSASLNPPLILWGLSKSSSKIDAFCSCRAFRVHVMAAHQLDLTRLFATHGLDMPLHVGWTVGNDGLPRLRECAGWFECDHQSHVEVGDHIMFIGRVRAYARHQDNVLVFHGGRYLAESEFVGAASAEHQSVNLYSTNKEAL